MTHQHPEPLVPREFPEAGSIDGVHLREGRLAGVSALEAPEAFRRGALYCVYLRAHSAEGTFTAVTRDLDRIAALGASAIWLLPIHPCGRVGRKGSVGSPYAIHDYRAVDPAYGAPGDLRALVDAAHERDLRVLIDFVANHAALDHPLVALHRDWFARDAEGNPTRRVGDWSDVVDWNHEPPAATQHLVGSALHWLWDAGLDGFRCDVAGMVPRAFWRTLREAMTPLRPDHFMLAEWQDAELHTIAFHASYDWLLYRALRDVGKGEADARKVARALRTWSESFPAAALPLRFLENHDEPRVLSWLAKDRLPAYAAVAILSGGLPLLYGGQEIGETHRPSLFDAEPIDWNGSDPAITDIYRGLLARQRGDGPWGPGPAALVESDHPEAIVAFTRSGAAREGLVVAHLGTKPVTVRLRGLDTGRRFRRDGDDLWSDGAAMTLSPGEAWIGESV